MLASITVGCSNEIETENVLSTGKDYWNFEINVSGKSAFNNGTRAYTNKTEWNDGDIIYLVVDGKEETKCPITYTKNGWDVANLNPENFSKSEGFITAIYSDKITLDQDNIITSGDILYTENGIYSKAQNAIYINLPMEKRPISRIKIKGIADNFKLKATGFEKIISTNPIKWSDTKLIKCYDYEEDIAVYFGLVTPDVDGTTTIELSNDESGITYTRKFNKTMEAGDAIVIEGPNSNEAEMWNEAIHIINIELSKTTANLLVGEELELNAILTPENASNKNIIWTSSDESIATVESVETSSIAHIKALSPGNVTITATTVDGAKVATCDVLVGNVEDFVQTYLSSVSYTSFNGLVTAAFDLNVKNILANNIYISTIEVYNGNNQQLIKQFSVDEYVESNKIWEYGINVGPIWCTDFIFKVTFTYEGKTYSSLYEYDLNK